MGAQNIILSGLIKDDEPIILDLDFDFFLNSEHDIRSFPWKDYSTDVTDFFDQHKFVNFQPVIGHDEALDNWLQLSLRDVTCIHIDHHHDLHISDDEIDNCHENQFYDVLSCGNYLSFALKKRILKKLVWVYPDKKDEISLPTLSRQMIGNGCQIVSVPYSDYCRWLLPVIKNCRVVSAIIALSPDFIPEEKIKDFFEFVVCDKEFKYRAYDYAYDRIISHYGKNSVFRFPNKFENQVTAYFHGSNSSGLKVINSNDGSVFVSSSSGFASCYGLQISDDAWFQGIDRLAARREMVYVIPTGNQDLRDLSDPLFLYLVNVAPDTLTATNGCEDYIFETSNSVPVINCINFSSTEEALLKFKVAILEHNIWEELFKKTGSKKRVKDFSNWMQLPEKIVEKLPSAAIYWKIFHLLNGAVGARRLFVPLVYWRRLIQRELFSDICTDGIDEEPYHGFSHALEVAQTCIVISLYYDVNPIATCYAALCHDAVREYEDNKKNMEASANELRSRFCGRWKEYANSRIEEEACTAILNHGHDHPTQHLPSLHLRDADRVRLAWERGYDKQYFSTSLGRKIAGRTPQFLEGLKKALSFDEGCTLEVCLNLDQFQLSLFFDGRFWHIDSTAHFNVYQLNEIIFQYNITRVVLVDIDHNQFESFVGYWFSLGICVEVCFPNVAKFDHFFSSVPLDFPKVGASIIIDSEEQFEEVQKYITGPKYKVEATGGLILYFNLTKTNWTWFADNLDHIVEQEFSTVPIFSIGEEWAEEWFSAFAARLLSIKKSNPYVTDVRIRGFFPWCAVGNIAFAFTLFETASNNYFPFSLAPSGKVYDFYQLVSQVFLDVEGRYEVCGSCPYYSSCGALPSVSEADWSLIKGLPGYLAAISWMPYSPENMRC